ncbi:MAG: secretion system protein [Chloroflexi bacterium]|nr:MAG: secretion system protein [Chloroflexota bacterium]
MTPSAILLVSFLITMAILLVLVGLYRWLSWTRELERSFHEQFAAVSFEDGMRKGQLRKDLDKRLKRYGFTQRLQQQLSVAGITMTATEYIMLNLAIAVVAFALGWLISRQFLAGVFLAIIGALVMNMRLKRRQSKRIKAFNDQLPDVINLLVSSLHAGYGLTNALAAVVEEMPDPSASEFRRVLKATLLGYSLEEALEELAHRMQSDDLDMIVTSISIQNEVGGNLAEILESISQTIRMRIQLAGEVQTLTSEQRFSGTVLTGLPFVLATIIMLINPDYMMEIFQPGWVRIIPALVIVLTIGGYFLMRRMLYIEF